MHAPRISGDSSPWTLAESDERIDAIDWSAKDQNIVSIETMSLRDLDGHPLRQPHSTPFRRPNEWRLFRIESLASPGSTFWSEAVFRVFTRALRGPSPHEGGAPAHSRARALTPLLKRKQSSLRHRRPSRTPPSRRVPDGLTGSKVIEAKAGSRIELSGQIKDFMTFADQTGKEFILIVKKEADVADELLELAEEGAITILKE